jgi:hypothetical protein
MKVNEEILEKIYNKYKTDIVVSQEKNHEGKVEYRFTGIRYTDLRELLNEYLYETERKEVPFEDW